jgi:hypothetical protein
MGCGITCLKGGVVHILLIHYSFQYREKEIESRMQLVEKFKKELFDKHKAKEDELEAAKVNSEYVLRIFSPALVLSSFERVISCTLFSNGVRSLWKKFVVILDTQLIPKMNGSRKC